jgi:RNA polymerase sigma-70 factor (ECF subfamily)
MYGMGGDFEEVWRECSGAIHRFLLHSVREIADADDLLHDVAVKALEKWQSLRNHDVARAWLFQIARNLVRDFYRKHKPILLETEALEGLLDSYEAVVTATNIDVDRIATREFLSALPSPWASILLLHVFHGYTIRETADLLNVNRWTIGKHMPRMIRDLASALYGEEV